MRDLPAGTVTLCFTDIEGSRQRLQHLGDKYGDALAAHRDPLHAALRAHGGAEVDTQGAAFFTAFSGIARAVTMAVNAQRALTACP